MKLVPPLVGLIACALLALPALAADAGPPDLVLRLKQDIDRTAGDAAHAIAVERGRATTRLPIDRASAPPWLAADPCARPRMQYWQAFGEYMVGTVRHPRREGDAIHTLNSRIRMNVAKMARIFAAEPDRAFLRPGESLDKPAGSWSVAARQRAEWSVLLRAVLSGVTAQAEDRTDYGANYAAGVWTRAWCDYAGGHGAFLAGYRDAVGQPSAEDLPAIDYLQGAALPPPGP